MYNRDIRWNISKYPIPSSTKQLKQLFSYKMSSKELQSMIEKIKKNLY